MTTQELKMTTQVPMTTLKPALKKYDADDVYRLMNVLPEFWIRKMKTAFKHFDRNGDGYINRKDIRIWNKAFQSSFPGKSCEQIEAMSIQTLQLNDFSSDDIDDKGVSECTWIMKQYSILSTYGVCYFRDQLCKHFNLLGDETRNYISREEHKGYFDLDEEDYDVKTTVAFLAVDQDRDGKISRCEFIEAGVDFYCNFADETKPSKHFFGPLVKH